MRGLATALDLGFRRYSVSGSGGNLKDQRTLKSRGLYNYTKNLHSGI